MNAKTRHPLLVLSPQARRQLARTLVQGLVVKRKQELRSKTREGLVGGAVYGAVGAAGLAAWHAATGGAAAPFLAFWGLWGGVQAAFAAGLARQGLQLPAPLEPLVNGPLDLGEAVAAWALPRRLTPDRLVLAAGILVAVRRPVSHRLLTRLYGRAFPQGEVDHAIELLQHLGFVTNVDEQPGLLHLSQDGFQLLKNLGVPAPTARPRQDPSVAPHIVPLFAALEGRARRLPPEPEPVVAPPPRPAVELPVFNAPVALPELQAPEPPPEAFMPAPSPETFMPEPAPEAFMPGPPPKASVPEPTPEALMPEPPAEAVWPPAPPVEEIPEPTIPPILESLAEAEPVENPFPELIVPEAPPALEALPIPEALDYEEIDLGPDTGDLEPLPMRRKLRWRVPAAVAAALVALTGLLVYLLQTPFNPLRHPTEVVATAAHMPGPSRGIALQFNGRGKMLSTFGGGLYLSVPERLDYKTPLEFKDFDMASTCGLVDREVSRAAFSPTGRFLWTEMDQNGRRERCLVDLETKTVTHDLVARNATYGLPGMIGWAGEQVLLMSENAQPGPAGHWYAMDVATHQPKPLQLPEHGKLLPLATEAGVTMLAGWDMRKLGSWDLTVYRLDEKLTYQPLKKLETELPEALREAEPRLAAVSPDHRFLIATMRPVGVEVPAQGGSLLVVSLEDGGASTVTTAVPPLPDQPVFWAPEVQNGNYRFYYNGGGPEGVVPCAGEMHL